MEARPCTVAHNDIIISSIFSFGIPGSDLDQQRDITKILLPEKVIPKSDIYDLLKNKCSIKKHYMKSKRTFTLFREAGTLSTTVIKKVKHS